MQTGTRERQEYQEYQEYQTYQEKGDKQAGRGPIRLIIRNYAADTSSSSYSYYYYLLYYVLYTLRSHAHTGDIKHSLT